MSKIREAYKEDCNAIVGILMQYAVQKRTPLLEPYCRTIEELAKNVINESSVLNVAIQNGKIVGVISGSEIKNNEDINLYLNFIAVSKRYCNKGIGNELFQSIFGYVNERKIKDIIVEINIYERGAVDFFFKEGMEKVAYDSDENYLTLVKENKKNVG